MAVKFQLGQLVATAGIANAMDSCEEFRQFVYSSLSRYVEGDWGDLEEPDKEMNEEGLEMEGRLLAAYNMPTDIPIDYADKIWIITEWDRSATTILFPDEY